MPLRTSILKLLRGQRDETLPCFSCLSTIIAPALETRGLSFHEIHHDAQKMVTAAASAFELYGWQSATLPTDLIVEAEAFGAQIDFREDMPQAMWAFVPQPLFNSPAEVVMPHGDFTQRGRIPLVCDALRLLKARVGAEIVVGAWIPGPFTLANYVIEIESLFSGVIQAPNALERALDIFAEALIAVAGTYQEAGADFITIHEMGGSPGVLGPRAFGALVLPRLQNITRAISAPTILSVCGNTNNAMELLTQAGANALHVDQTNNLARSREILGRDAILFGNLDPVAVIANGTVQEIRTAAENAAHAGVDAIMPGCDLYLQTPAENLRVLLETAQAIHRRPHHASS